MTDLETELLDLVVEQHKAIDHLMAVLVARDDSFMPSKSRVWPTVVKASDMMKRLGRSL